VTAFILYRAFRQMSTLFSKKFSMYFSKQQGGRMPPSVCQ